MCSVKPTETFYSLPSISQFSFEKMKKSYATAKSWFSMFDTKESILGGLFKNIIGNCIRLFFCLQNISGAQK